MSDAAAPISRAHRSYMLTVMVLVYTFNFIDRSLLGVLGQPIKDDLKLQDWQLGVLGGLAFALLYSIGGLGVARFAERTNRVTIISAALAIWSAMTALCGAAVGFWSLALARVGVRMLLKRDFDRFSYYGRGPMENYPDRKAGSDLGIYASPVADQLTPYQKPMECGNHEDIRWATLHNNSASLTVQQTGQPLQVSALPFTDEQLENTEYRIDLPPSAATVLCIDARTLGVGSNSCGPRPLEKFTPRTTTQSFDYTLLLRPH